MSIFQSLKANSGQTDVNINGWVGLLGKLFKSRQNPVECPFSFSLHHLEGKVQYLEVQQPSCEHEDEGCHGSAEKARF